MLGSHPSPWVTRIDPLTVLVSAPRTALEKTVIMMMQITIPQVNRSRDRFTCGILIFIIMMTTFSSAVLGAETRTVNGSVMITQGDGWDPNMTFNLSDPNNTYLLNWNQTVQGFQNDSGLTGAFTGPYLPPIEIQAAVNLNDIETLTLCGQARFQCSWIMSGSSESWWRLPERGMDYGKMINLTIWHVGCPDLLNFTDEWIPNTISHPTEIFNYSYLLDSDELNKTFRWYNTTAWNHTFNSTWLRVAAPLHGDEFYAFRWEITNRSTWYEHWIRISQNDIGEDKAFTTWIFYPDGTRDFLAADLDVSVIHTFGMGYSTWGDEIVANATITFNTELDEPITNGDYLTVMVPFLEPVDNETNVRISFGTQNDSWSTFFWVAEDGPTDFGLLSVQWDVPWIATEMKISILNENRTRTPWIYDRNTVGDPDWGYDLNYYVVEDHDWAPDDYPFGGIPYHSIQITNGSWENAKVPTAFYLGGRQVDPSQVVPNVQHSDEWLIDIMVVGYEGMARITAAISFALTGQWDKVGPALDMNAPFPTDAPWYLGKYYLPAAIGVQEFLAGLAEKVWSALVWIYEGIQWVVKNAGWVLAGTLQLIVLLVVIPIWARFFKMIWGLIKFGWVVAQDGLVAGAEFADQFWQDFMSTSYVKKVAKTGIIQKIGKAGAVRLKSRMSRSE